MNALDKTDNSGIKQIRCLSAATFSALVFWCAVPTYTLAKDGFSFSVSGSLNAGLHYSETKTEDVDQPLSLTPEEKNQKSSTLKFDYSIYSASIRFALKYKKNSNLIDFGFGLSRTDEKQISLRAEGGEGKWKYRGYMAWSEEWNSKSSSGTGNGRGSQGGQWIELSNGVQTYRVGYDSFYNKHWQGGKYIGARGLADNSAWGRSIGGRVKGAQAELKRDELILTSFVSVDTNAKLFNLASNKDKYDFDEDGKADSIKVDNLLLGGRASYSREKWKVVVEYIEAGMRGNNDKQRDTFDSNTQGHGYRESARQFALGVSWRLSKPWLLALNYANLQHYASAGIHEDGRFRPPEKTDLSHAVFDINLSYDLDKTSGIGVLWGIRKHAKGERYYARSGLATSAQAYLQHSDSEAFLRKGSAANARQILHYEIGYTKRLGSVSLSANFASEHISPGGIYDSESQRPADGLRRTLSFNLNYFF